MIFSRRRFLQAAAGMPATFHVATRLGEKVHNYQPLSDGECVLLDDGAACALRESLTGFEIGLTAAGVAYQRASFPTRGRARLLIAPAAVLGEPRWADWLSGFLGGGGLALLESGAAFLPPREFASQKRRLESQSGVVIGHPVRVWEDPAPAGRVPFVDYSWPLRTKVRDFSLALPLSAADGEAVAWLGETLVGLRRKVGGGTLVFLGSPIGPHLYAGDPQALRWLVKLCARAGCQFTS